MKNIKLLAAVILATLLMTCLVACGSEQWGDRIERLSVERKGIEYTRVSHDECEYYKDMIKDRANVRLKEDVKAAYVLESDDGECTVIIFGNESDATLAVDSIDDWNSYSEVAIQKGDTVICGEEDLVDLVLGK